MTFGLQNAAQTFQRFMHMILRDLPFIFVYIDDILEASKDRSENLWHPKALFERLEQHGLVINVEKCKFAQTSVSFLGHFIAKEGFKSSISGRIFVYHRISLQPTIVKFSNQISLKKSNDISKPYVRSLHRVTPVLNHLYLKSSTNAHTFSSGSTQCANPCSDRTTDHTN